MVVNKSHISKMIVNEANKIRTLYFLVLSCTASWLPIFADYLKDRGLNGIQIGVILSITPFMMFVVQPFYGAIADKLGYKKCLIVSSVLASCSFALFLLKGGFIWLFLITVLMSLFYNTIQPLLDSLTLALAEKDKNLNYGIIRIAGALGWALTGSVVGYFIDSISTTVIFAFSAASMFLTFVVAFSLSSGNESQSVSGSKNSPNIFLILSNKYLVFLLLCVFLVSACATTIWNFYSIYMKENGASSSLVGIGLSLQGLSELPLFYFAARIIKRFSIKHTLIITVLATALRMYLYSAIKTPEAALAIEVLHGFSWSLFWVVCVEYVDKLVQENWRATGQSLLYGAYFGVGAIAGNFWTGYLYDTKMKIADIFLLNAFIILAVGVFIRIFMKDVKMEEEPILGGEGRK
jgi:MFS transporter, PPP family, 3-phenylpropionic acid transporter